MEINIQIKNVQKPEDVITAFAAIGRDKHSGKDRQRHPHLATDL